MLEKFHECLNHDRKLNFSGLIKLMRMACGVEFACKAMFLSHVT